MEREHTDRIKFSLALVWLLFTMSLGTWWLIFGLRHAETEAVRRMLTGEGVALLASLLVGGTALLYGIRREQIRHGVVEEFFAAFTHDLRTALASLQLQVESLEEDLREKGDDNPLLERLMKDSLRIQLQLDNSLFYANRRNGKLFLEKLSLRRTVESLAREFGDLRVSLQDDISVVADARALEVVLRNLFQNALIHGRADSIDIQLSDRGASKVAVRVEDNGSGPETEPSALGRLFFRPTTRSGTGVGLFISRRLMTRMNGVLTFSRGIRGLVATLELEKAPS
jgi:signal transduction histidine kinase